MTTSSVYTFGTAATNSGVGSVDWTNAANALVDDANYASCAPGTGNQSYWLLLLNPNPTEIGDSDTIDAFRVRIRRSASTSNRISWNSIRAWVAGAVDGDEQAPAGNWASSAVTDELGDLVVDVWGITGLTGADVKASNFGVALSINGASTAEGRIEFGDIAFVYTAASGTTYTLDISGTLSPSGAISRTVGKALAGALTFAGNVARKTQKALSGALSTAGGLAQRIVFTISLAGSLATGGALSRSTGKALAGALASAGNVARKTNKALNGALSTAGSLAASTGGAVAAYLLTLPVRSKSLTLSARTRALTLINRVKSLNIFKRGT